MNGDKWTILVVGFLILLFYIFILSLYFYIYSFTTLIKIKQINDTK